MFRRW